MVEIMEQVVTHAKNNPNISAFDTTRSTVNWQNILWREWRNSHDEEYARHLFRLIGTEPISQREQAAILMVGLFWGGLLGALLDSSLGSTNFPIFTLGVSFGCGLLSWWLSKKIPTSLWLASLTPNNILNALAPHYQFLIIILLCSFFLHENIFIGGISVGLIAGLVLGLVLSVLSWPLLLILSFWIFQNQNAIPPNAITVWASIGVGLGIGIVAGAKPNFKHDYKYRDLCFWWRKQPLPIEIKNALNQVNQIHPYRASAWKNLLSRSEIEKKPEVSPENYIAGLEHDSWLERFIARHALVVLGGEAVEALLEEVKNPTNPLQQTARRLLLAIENETVTRIGKATLEPLCARCLLRCQYFALLPTQDFSSTYYGCRLCHQSQDILNGKVSAVLDKTMTADLTQQAGLIQINWLTYRNLFDFDQVEIIDASDEDVERFAMQVGNDTDLFRKAKYKQIHCFIKESCPLITKYNPRFRSCI